MVAMGTAPRESGAICTAGGRDMQAEILVWSTSTTDIPVQMLWFCSGTETIQQSGH